MALGGRRRAPHRLLVLILVVTLIPAAALIWLSWRILEQDRVLERQRLQDRLERTADAVSAALARRLSDIEERLPTLWNNPPSPLPDDAVLVSFGSAAVDARPADRLSYWPVVPPPVEPPRILWAAGEAFEFRDANPPRAILAFEALARSTDPAVRAGALARLARNLRKLHRHDEALTAYADLAELATATVDGTPADLLAREARCVVLEAMGRRDELAREARSLDADLSAGRWKLDAVSYEFHVHEVQRWLGGAPLARPSHETAIARAAAVHWLWQQRPAILQDEVAERGRRSLWINGQPILIVWRRAPEKLLALIAGPQYLESQWADAWRDQGAAVVLTDADGHRVFGLPAAAAEPQAVRAAAETDLPWTMRVTSDGATAKAIDGSGRRRLLLAGLGILGFVVFIASYAAVRWAGREAAVAQMQSDFVSAVSHEFRTPLTSMRHLTELLRDNLVRDEPRRRQYYDVLARETERLHRLVESLLDFGRMEAGAHEYRFELLDSAAFIEGVVEEFRAELRDARVVEVAGNGHVPRIRVDREALGRAVWNLLDNAVKYSPSGSLVRVELAATGENVTIRVIDRGPGIADAEKKEIFRKFARGAASRASGIKGTGIGLAMVQHIVAAHGGRIGLESEPGRGSTFTIVLPAETDG